MQFLAFRTPLPAAPQLFRTLQGSSQPQDEKAFLTVWPPAKSARALPAPGSPTVCQCISNLAVRGICPLFSLAPLRHAGLVDRGTGAACEFHCSVLLTRQVRTASGSALATRYTVQHSGEGSPTERVSSTRQVLGTLTSRLSLPILDVAADSR
jgi:hypothetical protein